MLRPAARALAGLLLAASAPFGLAQVRNLDECAAVEDDRDRLACYDEVAGRPPRAPAVALPPSDGPPPTLPEKAAVAGEFVGARPPVGVEASALALKWELDDDTRYGVFRFRTHKPNYLLPARYSDNPNAQPTSPSLGVAPYEELDRVEAKFQFSLKTKVAQGLFDGRLDFWAAYTQQSNWQLYSPSSPFRETDYEPELMGVLHVDQPLPGLRLRMINLGYVHQSNGRGDTLSRSWNRLYAQVGMERGDFALLVRPWWRIPEGSDDHNPDIEDYVGKGDALLFWRLGGHSLGLTLRSNLSFDEHRGAVQLDWRFPLYRNLKGYVQVFSGYGESLIDYNWSQDVIGVGVSLSDWM